MMYGEFKSRLGLRLLGVVFVLLVASGCGSRSGDSNLLTIYSGRSEDLIAPLISRFSEQTGIKVRVRYGGTAELAATILEEGGNSPADVFFAQDASSLGALNRAGRLAPLPAPLLDLVAPRFRSPDGTWVGISGRARVLVYNTHRLSPEELPTDLEDLVRPEWRGRVGWAPINASFQSFITALRVTEGEEWTKDWLVAMRANQPRSYARNTAIIQAVASGEIDAGLSNHYYLYVLGRDTALAAKNHVLSRGSLMNVAGVGMLTTSRRADAAKVFVQFLLSPEAQQYITETTFEYPLVASAPVNPILPAVEEKELPDLDLNRLEDLEGTLRLLQDLGIL